MPPTSPIPAAARRNRWAIGFADLLLLLLGFFVLLQASGPRRDAMLAQVSNQFGGQAGNRAMRKGLELRAADLFTPGEALLTPAGTARLTQIARSVEGGVMIRSRGTDAAQQRFDDWDLAAARLGAVARALRQAGVAEGALQIRGLDQADGLAGQGQLILIAPAE